MNAKSLIAIEKVFTAQKEFETSAVTDESISDDDYEAIRVAFNQLYKAVRKAQRNAKA